MHKQHLMQNLSNSNILSFWHLRISASFKAYLLSNNWNWCKYWCLFLHLSKWNSFWNMSRRLHVRNCNNVMMWILLCDKLATLLRETIIFYQPQFRIISSTFWLEIYRMPYFILIHLYLLTSSTANWIIIPSSKLNKNKCWQWVLWETVIN